MKEITSLAQVSYLVNMIRLRLIRQRILLKFGNELLKRLVEAQQIGERIFKIKIPCLLEGAGADSYDFSQQRYISTLGNYDFRNDIVTIYAGRVQSICRRYKLDFESSLIHHVCHELGHAKEARLFEESGIFPYRFNILDECPVRLDSKYYFLEKIKIGGRSLHKVFMLGIQDYPIEQELQKYGIRDSFSKLRTWNIWNLQRLVNLPRQKHRLTVEALSLLPFDICHYVYGELTRDERLSIENYYRTLIEDKWDFALEIMKDLHYGDSKKYVYVVQKLFKRILGLDVFLMENNRRQLFLGYKRIPEFWDKRSYSVFYVLPSLEGNG